MIIDVPKQKIDISSFLPAFFVTGIYAEINMIISATAGLDSKHSKSLRTYI